MRYVLVQGRVDTEGVLHKAIDKKFNKYDLAVKEFELIKNNHYDYNLVKGEHLVTIVAFGDDILNLYKCYPQYRIFKL